MLCTTFKKLAEDTWEKLDISKSLGFQLKEETFTDLNLLGLKRKHPTEIHTRVFNKHEEGINGADWEWWLTDGTDWYGFRVQAKIINIKTDRFEHLHYQGKASIPQCKKLIEQASPKGGLPRFPLYCLYLSTEVLDSKILKSNLEFYGCSLISAFDVLNLRPDTDHIKSLQRFIVPWHKLVCKDPKIALATHMDKFLIEDLDEDLLNSVLYATTNPPDYVRSVLQENSAPTENDYGIPDLAGIVVFDLSGVE